MIRILSWLKSNAPQATVVVAVNRVGPNGSTEISRKEFETTIEHKIDHAIPFDVKVVCQAAKLGKSVAEVGKSSKMGQELYQICASLLAVADGGEAPKTVKTSSNSLASKLGGFKSMFPGKNKSKEKKES
jgi:pilus assembly protein CpaE